MQADILQAVAEIDSLASVHEVEDLYRLEELASTFFKHPEAAEHLGVWFRLYERFPEDDGFGVFWSILHGIEAQPGYQALVVESLRRRPSQFPMRMVGGMLNAGFAAVGDVDLMGLLEGVAVNQHCPPAVRREAKDLIDYQRGRL